MKKKKTNKREPRIRGSRMNDRKEVMRYAERKKDGKSPIIDEREERACAGHERDIATIRKFKGTARASGACMAERAGPAAAGPLYARDHDDAEDAVAAALSAGRPGREGEEEGGGARRRPCTSTLPRKKYSPTILFRRSRRLLFFGLLFFYKLPRSRTRPRRHLLVASLLVTVPDARPAGVRGEGFFDT